MVKLNKHLLISSMGGKATLKKYGKDHFKMLAKKRWDKYKNNIKKNDNKRTKKTK